MSAFASPTLPQFAAAIADGLSAVHKHIPSRYLYDEIGLALFDVITKLPEYGIGRAEERLCRRHSQELRGLLHPDIAIVDLAGGNNPAGRFLRTDVSVPLEKYSVCSTDWLERAAQFACNRPATRPLLFTLLGGSAGSLDRAAFRSFLERVRTILKPGDHILFSADLVKDKDKILADYDDDAGIISSFHKNLLVRINRELGGHFKVRNFNHEVRWDAFRKRVEFHLVSKTCQNAYVGSLGRRFSFETGESICTEFAFKFSELELEDLATFTRFRTVKTWMDIELAFAQVLWAV
jgi:uncharacterized SAM-dependent methyltransferase